MMVAVFLRLENDYVYFAVMGFMIVSGPISESIAIPILRRRVVPPCIRVKDITAAFIILSYHSSPSHSLSLSLSNGFSFPSDGARSWSSDGRNNYGPNSFRIWKDRDL